MNDREEKLHDEMIKILSDIDNHKLSIQSLRERKWELERMIKKIEKLDEKMDDFFKKDESNEADKNEE